MEIFQVSLIQKASVTGSPRKGCSSSLKQLANLVYYIISFRPHPIKFSKDFAENALEGQRATGIVNNEVYHSDDRPVLVQ